MTETPQESVEDFINQNAWQIRSCQTYKEEYDDCTSFKARFHQYFIFGKSIDCSQWKVDHENCTKWSEKNDKQAAVDVIKSEAARRKKRLDDHFNNNIWEKRTEPPEDWAKPLPEWMQKQHETSYLGIKSKELKENKVNMGDIYSNRTFCTIM